MVQPQICQSNQRGPKGPKGFPDRPLGAFTRILGLVNGGSGMEPTEVVEG